MTACTRALLACILAFALAPGAEAQTRKSAGAWSIVCSGGAAGYCSASNRVKSVSGPYRFQLNVSRERPGAEFEVALLTGYQHPGDGSVIAVQVDGGRPLKLAPAAGYRRAGRSNTYVVTAAETERLLAQMRDGTRARFRFEDAKGTPVDATFALAGLSNAIALMDKVQPAPRRGAASRAEKQSVAAERMPEPATPQPKTPAAQAAVAPDAPPQAAGALPATPGVPPAVPPTAAQGTLPPRSAPRTPDAVVPTPSAPPAQPAPAAPASPAAGRASPTAPVASSAPAGPARQAATAPAAASTATPGATAVPAPTAAPGPTAPRASAAAVPAPATATAPAPTAAPVSARPSTAASAPTTPRPATAPAPATTPVPATAPTSTAATPPSATAVPAPTVAPAPATAAAAPSTATPAAAPATAAAPPSEMQSKPPRAPATQTAPAGAQSTAADPRRKAAQKQAAVTTAPSASRKRGAKSVRQFSCRGNEPSWSFVIDGDRARYASMAEPDAIEVAGKLGVTGDGPTPIVDWRGKSDWGGKFRAVVTEERCRDSMSDSEGQTEFEYRAQLALPGGNTVRGCCNAGLPPVAAAPPDTTQYPIADLRRRPETDWTRHLFDLLPAIQACIDKTPEPAPYASKAWPMNQGMVGVRTRNGQGGWYECVADANGSSIERFVALPSAAPLAPNEDRVVFSPPDHPPPPGGCYKHERVMDGMGDFMGWLSTNACS